MKAILLAAGRGSRISRHIQNMPKCMVDIGNGTKLIKYTIDLLKRNNINDITMVLGYENEKIYDFLKNENIKFYYNYFYNVTNSIASLWFSKNELENDDVIIMNADVFLQQETLDLILNEKLDPVLFADENKKEGADYKFYYENNILIKYGKGLSLNETTAEYIGIAKISKKFLPNFKKSLEDKIKNLEHDKWWEDVLYDMHKEKNIYVRDINGCFWSEVDYIEDYQNILKFVERNLK